MISVYLRLTFAGLLLALGLLIGAGGALQAATPGGAPTPLTMVPTQSIYPTLVPTAPPTLPPPVPTVPTTPIPGLTDCALAIPGFGSRMFPQTGHAMSGIFLDTWDGSGGLAQQGYPISDVIQEVSDLDRIPYQVQYFERSVFEYHPENNGTGYEVLLAQLGTYQYRQKYPTGAPGQRPNGERPRYFAETRHTLGGEFRTYWETHNGLPQQGFPISDEFTEISPLDGKPYTVQYFERAVFEYHPENQPPYRVLLSQLGTLRYRAKYPVTPGASPTPAPLAARYLGSVNGDRSGRADLAAAGGWIFWFDADPPNPGEYLLGYNAVTGQQLTVFAHPNLTPPTGPRPGSSLVTTDGQTVAWLESGPTSGGYTSVIHGYSLRLGREFSSTVPFVGEDGGFAVDGDTLYTLRRTADTVAVYAHNWTTGQDTRVATATPAYAAHLVAGNGYVLWTDEDAQSRYRLRLASARNPALLTTISEGLLTPPTAIITGDQVVWTQALTYDGGPTAVHLYTISTRAGQVLLREPGGVDSLSTAGTQVAWRRVPAGDLAACLSVALFDLPTHQLQVGAVPSYGGRQVALLGPAALVYGQVGEPFQIYLQPLR